MPDPSPSRSPSPQPSRGPAHGPASPPAFHPALGPALQAGPWRAALQARGRVQIPGYLREDVAQRLHACLSREVPWTLAVRDEEGPRTIDHARYAALDADAVAQLLARAGRGAPGGVDSPDAFRFAYDSYMMVTAYQQGRDPGLVLHRVLEWLNSPGYLDWARELTGDARIRRCSAQATRYRPGHFLRRHTDQETSQGRLYAYVLNLSREWEPDWGGLLQFIDGDGAVVDTFLPRWNSLSLFAVPAHHAVSLVAPWAGGDRLAITGWMLL